MGNLLVTLQKNQTKCKCFICKKYISIGTEVRAVPNNKGALFLVHKNCTLDGDKE